MPISLDKYQLGYAQAPDSFWSSLANTIEQLHTKPNQTPWGFHEPTITASEAVGPVASTAGDILSDPRNSWMGFGPIAMVAKPAGWGAEVLRRYKLLGGTPESLRRTLTNQSMLTGDRDAVVSGFRLGTDIAAPPNVSKYGTPGYPQQAAMEMAGEAYDNALRYTNVSSPLNSKPIAPVMESAQKGNAAYDAVSRQVARMLDQPGFGFKKAQDLPLVSDKQYFEQFPLKSQENRYWLESSPFTRDIGGLAGANARPNVRR